MSEERIPLDRQQKEIMGEFYNFPKTKVIFNEKQRDEIWRMATKHDSQLNLTELKNKCPALEHQIKKSCENNKNIQSAVFSECAYAQTIANIFNLPVFVICSENPDFISSKIMSLLDSYNLVPRYAYSTKDKHRMLIQAGSCEGIDSALITVVEDIIIYTIEFKEPAAKTSEPDLPKYEENGVIEKCDKWLNDNRQFKKMIEEQKKLNFFDHIGHNIHEFSKESITYAIIHNYIGKALNVICTEDINGFLVMMPANQVHLWARTEGEIRTAGRNHCKVWTPAALSRFLLKYDPDIIGTQVKLEKSKLETRTERGGNGRISGYKINPLFFVYAKDCENDGNFITFNLIKVQQLRPTITAKLFFETLKYDDVKSFYQNQF